MMLIVFPLIAVVALVILFAVEHHANEKRARYGQPTKQYHDITDAPPPVNVIDISRR